MQWRGIAGGLLEGFLKLAHSQKLHESPHTVVTNACHRIMTIKPGRSLLAYHLQINHLHSFTVKANIRQVQLLFVSTQPHLG